jgi:hypothetical protein
VRDYEVPRPGFARDQNGESCSPFCSFLVPWLGSEPDRKAEELLTLLKHKILN